jgi:uridine kinase
VLAATVLAMEMSQLVAELENRLSHGRPVLIGIEGFGGSGKTTFATELRPALDSAYVVGLDDFIVKDKLANAPWDTGAFDHVRLQQQVLQPARTGVRSATRNSPGRRAVSER